jgi:DNA helicase-2/ATP-dependent DNA helicase PcrA
MVASRYFNADKKGRTPSNYQAAVFRAVAETVDNLIVDSVAGSGKTTTIENTVEFIPPTLRAAVVCFNVHIRRELSERLPKHITVSTLNSAGWKIICDHYGRKNVDVDEFKTANTLEFVFFPKVETDAEKQKLARFRAAAVALVSKLKHRGLPAVPDDATLASIAARYEITVPGDDDFVPTLRKLYDRLNANKAVFDYDDQLSHPLLHNLPFPQFDVVLVDEYQDLSPVQIEFLRRYGKRLIFVGDPDQAIYGFRGADSEAVAAIGERFNARRLPLSVCYRCATAIVEHAQQWVPRIEAAPGAPRGLVDEAVTYDTFLQSAAPGDFVLGRTTAPLVDECLRFIRDGKKATVRGKNIGGQILALADTVYGRFAGTKRPLGERVELYRANESERLTAARCPSALSEMNDRCDTLLAIIAASDDDSLAAVKRTVMRIFSDDDKPGVTFCTVHRAKGLEADNVWIIRPELMPHSLAVQDWQIEEERHLQYVAATRARLAVRYVVTPEDKAPAKAAKPAAAAVTPAAAE